MTLTQLDTFIRVPDGDGTKDLGSASFQIRDIYLDRRIVLGDVVASPTVAGQFQRNGNNLEFYNTAARQIYMQGGTDVAVADGGTGLSSGTSGGILGFTATGTIASSVALTANALVIGGGAGATPTPMTGTSGGVPYFNAATTVASSGALTANAIVLGGGAGAAPTPMTGTSGGVPYFNATTTVASSGLLTANAIVLGGGAGAAPTPMTGTSGGIPYFNAATTVASSALLLANAIVLGGGAGAAPATMTDPGVDSLIFWDESANAVVYLTVGSGLTITDTTITASSGPSAASQAEMEAASSTTVYASPGRTKYHPGVAKFFTHHDNAGNNIISYNVSSVTDTAVGDHLVNLTTAFSASQVGAVFATHGDGAGQAAYASSTGTNTVRMTIRDTETAYGLEDPTSGNWHAAGFGDQA